MYLPSTPYVQEQHSQFRPPQLLSSSLRGYPSVEFAQILNAPINTDLKEITVTRWDNPWLTGSQKKWPNEVTDEGRALIADWLKSEFIEAFFTKMAEDGDTDRRRLDFWMKYRKHMNHVHFALGTGIVESTDPDLIFLKNKMKGLISH